MTQGHTDVDIVRLVFRDMFLEHGMEQENSNTWSRRSESLAGRAKGFVTARGSMSVSSSAIYTGKWSTLMAWNSIDASLAVGLRANKATATWCPEGCSYDHTTTRHIRSRPCAGQNGWASSLASRARKYPIPDTFLD